MKQLAKLCDEFEANGFGQLSQIIEEQLDDLVTTYSYAWVRQAMTEAVEYNKRSLKYMRRVLSTWNAEGGPDAAKAKHEAAVSSQTLLYV
ncbi:DnaD domain-containing protein [Alicyclobacillus sp. SO9]|uniref:DnaD domain-containing protein n=1 Tax=Alicyclobacillus sp. SO9 TaxID=2665646 RepID=UPI0018E77F43|nr:DnaD domain protein [Alicyclobacillus sp. SO9]QQE78087.1 DnaD domain protein [Alicyclobacillus sp. SO9]